MSLRLACVVSVLLASGQAVGQERQRPHTISAGLSGAFFGVWWINPQIEYGGSPTAWLELTLNIGWGASDDSLEGFNAGIGIRLRPTQATDHDRAGFTGHALTVAITVRLWTFHQPVWIEPELGYEFRHGSGFSMFFGAGAALHAHSEGGAPQLRLLGGYSSP